MTVLIVLLSAYAFGISVATYFAIENYVHARSQWKHWECIAREFKEYVIHKEDE